MHVFSIWTATKAWSFTSKQYDMTVWTGMLVTTIYMAPCRLRCCNGTDKPGVNDGFSMMSSTQRWHEYRAMFVSYRYTYLFAFTTLLNHSYDDVDRDSCRTNAQWADVEKHRYGVQHIKGCPSDRNERRQLRPSNRFWSQNVHVPHFFESCKQSKEARGSGVKQVIEGSRVPSKNWQQLLLSKTLHGTARELHAFTTILLERRS